MILLVCLLFLIVGVFSVTDKLFEWSQECVCLESIEQLHYRQYKLTIAIDDSDDHPTQICFAHHCIRAALGFTAPGGGLISERG